MRHFSIYNIRCYQPNFSYALSMAFRNSNSDFVKIRCLGKWLIGQTIGGKKGYFEHIPTCLNVCNWNLLIFIAKVILIRNRLLRSLKWMEGYTWSNWLLVIRLVFVEPKTSTGRSVRASLLRTYAATSGSRGKLMYFPRLPIETILPILTQKCVFIRKHLKQKRLPLMPNHNLYENLSWKDPFDMSIIMMSQKRAVCVCSYMIK